MNEQQLGKVQKKITATGKSQTKPKQPKNEIYNSLPNYYINRNQKLH